MIAFNEFHQFLSSVGMTNYKQMLECAGITTIKEVSEVTDEFLSQTVGIDKALHRRKLLKGLERLRGAASESAVEVIAAEKYVPQISAAVQFKWGRVEYYGTWSIPENVLSTHVIVEGEEGYDMGYVISCSVLQSHETPPKFNIVRYATSDEIAAWTTSISDAEAKYCELLNHIQEVKDVVHIVKVVFRFDMREVCLLVSQTAIPSSVSKMLASYFPSSQMTFSLYDDYADEYNCSQLCDRSLSSLNSSDCLDTLSTPSV